MTMRSAAYSLIVATVLFSSSAWGDTAVPVSPGGGTAITVQNCPTFSWSAAEEASAYKLEVYEQMTIQPETREQIAATGKPVVAKEIAAPALSWTPSTGECLSRGVDYVWYVQGVDALGRGQWSEGGVFQVEASALSADQKEAVKDIVKEYLTGDDAPSTGSTSAAGSASGVHVTSKATAAIAPRDLLYETGTNTFLGAGSGAITVINGGGSDTFIGGGAGQVNTSGYANTFVDYAAGNANTTSHNNTFLGQAAGWKNTTGNDNTFLGNGAGQFYRTVHNNTFVGSGAGTGSTASGNPNTGAGNSFFGANAGYANINGNSNVYIGSKAGYSSEEGYSNTYIGAEAGYSTSSMNGNNVYVGYQTGYSNSSGANNVFVGTHAGRTSTGSYNVFIGKSAGFSESGSNKLYIDNCYTGAGCDKPLIKGDFNARTLQIDGSLTIVTVATPSDERYKREIQPLESSLEKVMHLQGVSYAWNKDEVKGAGFKDGRQIGLIAQEVEKVLPELVHTDDKGYKTLSYDKMVPVLIEAVKEQQKVIAEQKNEIADLNEKLSKALKMMEERLAALERPTQTVAITQ